MRSQAEAKRIACIRVPQGVGQRGIRINIRSSPRGAPRDSKSASTRVCDALCVAGTPLRGPMTTASGIWVPSTSAFTRVHSPSKTGVNALNDALCAGTTPRSITRIADRAGHLPPGRHFAFEIVRGLDLFLDHHVEADGL